MSLNPESPTADEVKDFHRAADTDSGPFAKHHTLGAKKDQAAPGNHTHDGSTSVKILKGVTISGSKGGNVALASVIAALVKLGATDTST